MTIGWKEYKCAELFEQVSTTKLKVKTKDCNPIGKYPVVDQGREKLAGFIDDEKRVISVSSPVCIFGDHTRVIKWIDFDFVPGADGTKILSPKSIINPRFFYYLLQNIPLIDKGYARHFKQLKEASVRVPEKTEQKHIADKLDSVLAKVEAAQARLDKIPAILKRFRQSVLAAATSGELTKEWRETHDAGSWVAVALKEVASGFNYGSSSKSQKEGDVPVLRMGNLQGGKLDWSDLVYSSDEKEISKYMLEYGDVLFNRTNSPELVGKTAIYRGEKKAIYAGYLIRVKGGDRLNSEFLNLQLNSPHARDYCWKVKTDGVSQSNINAKKLQAYEFELPSVEEQIEIVRHVNELFELANAVQKQFEIAKNRLSRLTQSTLARAFRGDLFLPLSISSAKGFSKAQRVPSNGDNAQLVGIASSTKEKVERSERSSESPHSSPPPKLTAEKRKFLAESPVLKTLEVSRTAQSAQDLLSAFDRKSFDTIDLIFSEIKELLALGVVEQLGEGQECLFRVKKR